LEPTRHPSRRQLRLCCPGRGLAGRPATEFSDIEFHPRIAPLLCLRSNSYPIPAKVNGSCSNPDACTWAGIRTVNSFLTFPQ